MLFVQGSRDAFGTPAELKPILEALDRPATLYVVAGGDHSFKLSASQPAKQAAVLADVEHTIVEWISRSAP
jgi:predicted alpha/beta-hydrolase family hydrolase